MAKAGKKRTRGKKANAVVDHYLRPTEQREAHNDFRTAGMAMRVVPVIDRLKEAGVLNDSEYRALSYYRDQASLADRSPVRSCLDDTVRGTGDGRGPGVTILSASIETGRIERNMGALWPLCRAVCVDDITLEQWCINRHGTMAPGAVFADPQHVGIATLELKYAAGGIIPRNG